MTVSRTLSLVAVILSVAIAAFYRYASYTCDHFDLDLSQAPGKIIVITGANSGLGLQSARVLAKAGSTVVMACRNMISCEQARNEILQEAPNANLTTLQLDLSSFRSVRVFAKSVEEQFGRVDVLMNNAGVMAIDTRTETEDGLEMQIGTNHFGHFLLTALLSPLFSTSARIVNVSSSMYVFGADASVFMQEIFNKDKYEPWSAYGNSKLANLYFTYFLNKRFKQMNKSQCSIAAHPGYTSTNLQQGVFPFWQQINQLFAMSTAQGAMSQIYAAVDPRARCSDRDFVGPQFSLVGAPSVQFTVSNAWNEKTQRELWFASMNITGLANNQQEEKTTKCVNVFDYC